MMCDPFRIRKVTDHRRVNSPRCVPCPTRMCPRATFKPVIAALHHRRDRGPGVVSGGASEVGGAGVKPGLRRHRRRRVKAWVSTIHRRRRRGGGRTGVGGGGISASCPSAKLNCLRTNATTASRPANSHRLPSHSSTIAAVAATAAPMASSANAARIAVALTRRDDRAAHTQHHRPCRRARPMALRRRVRRTAPLRPHRQRRDRLAAVVNRTPPLSCPGSTDTTRWLGRATATAGPPCRARESPAAIH